MNRQNALKNINLDNAKRFFINHKEKIKTAALPIAIGLAVLFFWFYGSGDEPEINDASSNTSSMSSETAEPSSAELEEGDIYVDIDGAVNNPGVYKVSQGTRLFQVIDLAGGLTEEAATGSLNRAEEVYDGQKITVISSTSDGSPESDHNSGGASGTSGITNGRVNINTADSVTLQTIPGIGPSKASRIIDYRNASGKFKKIEDIKNVTGIGDATFESIKDYITV